MQPMKNGFNMLKVNDSTHVPDLQLRKCPKNHQPIIMHYVNKVKAYLNFHINHLKLLKNK